MQKVIGTACVAFVVMRLGLRFVTQTGFQRKKMSLNVLLSRQSENSSIPATTTRKRRRRKRLLRRPSSKWKQSNKLLTLSSSTCVRSIISPRQSPTRTRKRKQPTVVAATPTPCCHCTSEFESKSCSLGKLPPTLNILITKFLIST